MNKQYYKPSRKIELDYYRKQMNKKSQKPLVDEDPEEKLPKNEFYIGTGHAKKESERKQQSGQQQTVPFNM